MTGFPDRIIMLQIVGDAFKWKKTHFKGVFFGYKLPGRAGVFLLFLFSSRADFSLLIRCKKCCHFFSLRCVVVKICNVFW